MQSRHLGGSRTAFLARWMLRALFLPVLFLALIPAIPATGPAVASELDRAALSKRFPEPFYVGERDTALPVWPLFRHNIPQSDDFIGYIFELIDLAPIAGYAGKPVNMLIAINPEGTFIGASVISHYEPIFNHGVSEDTAAQICRAVSRSGPETKHQSIGVKLLGRAAGNKQQIY